MLIYAGPNSITRRRRVHVCWAPMLLITGRTILDGRVYGAKVEIGHAEIRALRGYSPG
jgi:hypothetical protein